MVQAYRVREGLLEEVALKDVLELPVGTNLPRLPRTEGSWAVGLSVLEPEQLVTASI